MRKLIPNTLAALKINITSFVLLKILVMLLVVNTVQGQVAQTKLNSAAQARLAAENAISNNALDPLDDDCDQLVLPTIQFPHTDPKSGGRTFPRYVRASITTSSTGTLDSIADIIKANPVCRFKVTGYINTDNKNSQQQSWDKVNAVISYLSDKQGIQRKRLVFNYGVFGDTFTVDVTPTTEDGPSDVPAPSPSLQGF